ncbi:MAG: hypothetical protein LRY40_07535 [Shewanella fodinae]|nr:hypothetical protein [Shewanella fodinae]
MQLDEVQNTVRRISSYVQDCWFYQAAVPTYVGGCMVFAWATDDQNARQLPLAVLQERFSTGGNQHSLLHTSSASGEFCLACLC